MTKDQIMLLNRAVRALRDTSRQGYRYIDGVARCDIANLLVALERENKALQKQLEATQPKWNSVEERVPEQGTCVLAAFLYYDGYRIRTARYSVSEEEPIWLIGDMSAIGSTPTHWIPLPAPPEEEDED